MSNSENRYWPFQVLPPEQRTEYHQRQVDFLETAYQAGYKPYMFGSGEDFGATAGTRGGMIVYRGSRGKHWQVLLGTAEHTALSAHVDDFRCGADAVLRWLRGLDGAEIFEHLAGHFFTTPGCQFQANTERRAGEIIGHGARGKHWEIILGRTGDSSLAAHVTEFVYAAEALRRWLRGAGIPEILEYLAGHLLATADCPEGFAVREQRPIEERKPA